MREFSFATHAVRRSFGSGVGSLGGSDYGALNVAKDAVVASQFKAGKPGRYELDVVVVGVPVDADKRPFFDPSEWNDALSQSGYSGVTVDSIQFVVTGDASNPRSTGGSLDIFGWGTVVADYTYRLTMTVSEGASGGVSGLGLATIAWVGIAAAVIAVNLLIYKLTGTDVIVTAIRWLGQALGVAVDLALKPVTSISLTVIGIAALALFVLTKFGGRGSVGGFSIGGKR